MFVVITTVVVSHHFGIPLSLLLEPQLQERKLFESSQPDKYKRHHINESVAPSRKKSADGWMCNHEWSKAQVETHLSDGEER